MASQFNSWDSYFWEPGGSVLRNLYGERDGAALAKREYAETQAQQFDIERGAVAIPRTYDAAHVMDIHRQLFGNVYEWAGEFRTVDMSKSWPPELGRGHTEFLPADRIGSHLDQVQQRVAAAPWAEMDREQFAHAAADVFAWANYVHPAREGNGRTVKLFMQHVSELSRFELNYSPQISGVTPDLWNRASVLTSPDPGSIRPVPDAMVPVFQRLAQPRQTPIRQLDIAGERSKAKTEQKPLSLSERIAKNVSELRARGDDADPGRGGRGRGPGGR